EKHPLALVKSTSSHERPIIPVLQETDVWIHPANFDVQEKHFGYIPNLYIVPYVHVLEKHAIYVPQKQIHGGHTIPCLVKRDENLLLACDHRSHYPSNAKWSVQYPPSLLKQLYYPDPHRDHRQ